MFTGIVKETGRMGPVTKRGQSLQVAILCGETAESAAVGDSIAVNGVCLTVVSISPGKLVMDVGEETYRRTSLSSAKPGDPLNIEPALRIGDRLGGHIVMGHVDAVGTISARREETTQIVLEVKFPADLRPYLVEKGSVALDGVSLTVGRVHDDRFETYLIPHTVAETAFHTRRPGDLVNIEIDVIARYVRAAIERGEDADARIEDILKKFEYI
jgi:riboflavin synthase